MPITIKANIESMRDRILVTLPTLNTTLHDPKHSSFQQTTNSFLELSEDQKQTIFKTLPKVLLLIGNHESPKILFCQNLLTELWRNYKDDRPIPLWISLPQLKKPFAKTIEETLENHGFTADQIAELKRDHSFVFIVDGYEQLKQLQNVYVANHFNHWRAKTIITCSSEWASQFKDPFRYFMPFHSEHRQSQLLQIFTLTSFEPRSTFAPLPVRQLTESKEPVEIKEIPRYGKSFDKKDNDTKQLVISTLPDDTFFHHLFTKDQEKINFFANRVSESVIYKNYLFHLIEQSKTDERYVIAAANAITALNCARVSFSAKDFRNIRIANADVSYGIFDNTQLQGADLTGVNFTGAWLRQANLNSANLSNIELGELPSLQLPDIALVCCYSPDGRWLAVTCVGKNIYLYDTETFEQIHTFVEDQHFFDSASIAFDPKAKYLASGGLFPNVYLWNTMTGKLQHTIKHKKGGSKIAIDAQGKRMATSNDKLLCLWSMATYKLEKSFMIPKSLISCIVFNRTGNCLATGHYNQTVRLWNVITGKLLHIFTEYTGTIRNNQPHFRMSPGEYVAFDPTGELLAAGSADANVYLWDIVTGKLKRKLIGHVSSISSIIFHPKEKLLASAGVESNIRVWNIITGELLHILEGHTSSIYSLAFTIDGRYLASASSDKTVRFWLIKLNQPTNYSSCGPMAEVKSVAINPTTKLLACGSWDKNIYLWNVITGRLRNILKQHTAPVASVAFDPTGNYLASGSADNTICIWNMKTNALDTIYRGHTEIVNGVSFDPNGKFLASASWDKTVRLWNRSTNKLEHIFHGHKKQVITVVFDVKGDNLISGSADKTIYIWNLALKKFTHIFRGHEGWVNNIALSVDAKYLVSASNDNSARIWSTNTNKLEHILHHDEDEDEDEECDGIVFDPKGKWIVTASNCFIYLWDYLTAKRLSKIKVSHTSISSIDLQQVDDNLFLAVGSGQIVRCWKIIEKNKNEFHALLYWSSIQQALVADEACLGQVKNIKPKDFKLLQQQGADQLRHTEEKITPFAHCLIQAEDCYQKQNFKNAIEHSESALRLVKKKMRRDKEDHEFISGLHCTIANYYHCYAVEQKAEQKLDLAKKAIIKAEQHFKQSLSLIAKIASYAKYANFLLHQQRASEAVLQLKRAIQLEDKESKVRDKPRETSEVYVDYIARFTFDKLFQQELEYWQNGNIKAIFMVLYLLVIAFIQINEMESAFVLVGIFQDTIKEKYASEEDKYPLILSLLGHTEQLIHDHINAVESYQGALRREPDYTVAQQHLKQSAAICMTDLAVSLQRLGIFKSPSDMKVVDEKPNTTKSILQIIGDYLYKEPIVVPVYFPR